MRELFSNKIVILLMIIFGFIQGVFNTLGTIVGEIASRYGYSTVSKSNFLNFIGRMMHLFLGLCLSSEGS
jgi:hypothetical protein